MCNLYSMTSNLDAIINLFKVINHRVGNLELKPSIFPDMYAPIIHMPNSERALSMMRWGMPNPPAYGGWQTNIRNVKSPHWRRWLKPENRCLVPFTSFSEFAPEKNPATGKKDVVWFAVSDERPLFAFAGIWTVFHGERGTKSQPEPGPHDVFGFLTTEPNTVVEPIHPKAMPVILQQDNWETWLSASPEEAVRLQRPWPDDQLKIVKRGLDKDDIATSSI